MNAPAIAQARRWGADFVEALRRWEATTQAEARARLGGLCMFAVAIWFVFGRAILFDGDVYFGRGPDPPGTLWTYDWVKEEVLSGRFPLWTNRMYYPDGIDLVLRNGSNVIDAIVSIPFQLVFPVPGAVVATSAAILLGNGLTILPLLREFAPTRPLVRWSVATWWMVNPWTLGELDCGRPTQALLWFLPGAVLALYRLRSRRDAVLLGLYTGLQALSYWYMAPFMALILAPLGLSRVWRDGRPAAERLALAVGVAVVTVAPLAWPIARAWSQNAIPGLDVPYRETQMYAGAVLRFETIAILHWKIVAIAALIAVAARSLREPWLVGSMVVSFLLTAGLRFGYGGWEWENWPYIWAYEHSKFITRLNFPERALCVTYLVAAIPLASVLDSVRIKALPWLLVAVSLLEPVRRGLLPLKAKLAARIPATVMVEANPGPVLVTPLKSVDTALVQQIYHHQPLVSGMADHIPSVRSEHFTALLSSNPFVAALVFESAHTPAWTTSDVKKAREIVRWVWYDKELQEEANGSSKVTQDLDRLNSYLGTPYFEDETTVLWDIHRQGERAGPVETAEANAIRTALGERHSAFTRGDPVMLRQISADQKQEALETQAVPVKTPSKEERQAAEDEAAANARDHAAWETDPKPR